MEKSWMIFTLRDFDPSLFLVHVGANDLSWKDTQEVMTDRIIKTVEFLIREEKQRSGFQYSSKNICLFW